MTIGSGPDHDHGPWEPRAGEHSPRRSWTELGAEVFGRRPVPAQSALFPVPDDTGTADMIEVDGGLF